MTQEDSPESANIDLELKFEEANSLGSNKNYSSKRQQRRKNEEIEKNYQCGDKSCGQQYGTNAALYTHIQTKHNGIQPEGTQRPPIETQNGQKGRPMQMKDVFKPYAVIQDKVLDLTSSQSKSLRVLENQNFTELLHIIGLLGDVDGGHQFSRNSEDDISDFTQDDLGRLKKELEKDFPIEQAKLSNSIVDFFMVTKYYWKKTVIEELYSVLLYIYMFQGGRIKKLIEYIIIKQNDKKFQVFNEILKNQGDNSFETFVNDCYQQMSQA